MIMNLTEYQALLDDLYVLGDHTWSSNSFFTSECEIASAEGNLYTLVEDQSKYIINGYDYWEVYIYVNNKLRDYYQVIL